MLSLQQQVPAPSTVENGDPVFLPSGACAIVEERLAPLIKICNGYVVRTKDGDRLKVSWNGFLGWVTI